MDFDQIESKIKEYQSDGKRIFSTSSFQTHSLVLLHMLVRIDPGIPIYFINTGYMFPETLIFRDQVREQLGLNIVDLHSDTPKSLQMDKTGKLLYTTDPDHCCHINKVQPTDMVLRSYDVWINGVRSDQSSVRGAMTIEEPAPHDTIRFHPVLDWDVRRIFDYIREHKLPRHPLDSKGYASIGCEPCTRKMDPEMNERDARWFGLDKVECGLHTDLIKKA